MMRPQQGSPELLTSMRALFESIERWTGNIGVYLFFIIMLSVTSDVIARVITNKSITGVYELNEYLMVGGFLVLSYTQKQRGHVTVELILSRLKGKALYFTELGAMVLTFVICVIFLWQSILQLQLSISMKFISEGLIQYPQWPARVLVSFGFLLLCLRFAIQIFDKMSGKKEETAAVTEMVI